MIEDFHPGRDERGNLTDSHQNIKSDLDDLGSMIQVIKGQKQSPRIDEARQLTEPLDGSKDEPDSRQRRKERVSNDQESSDIEDSFDSFKKIFESVGGENARSKNSKKLEKLYAQESDPLRRLLILILSLQGQLDEIPASPEKEGRTKEGGTKVDVSYGFSGAKVEDDVIYSVTPEGVRPTNFRKKGDPYLYSTSFAPEQLPELKGQSKHARASFLLEKLTTGKITAEQYKDQMQKELDATNKQVDTAEGPAARDGAMRRRLQLTQDIALLDEMYLTRSSFAAYLNDGLEQAFRRVSHDSLEKYLTHKAQAPRDGWVTQWSEYQDIAKKFFSGARFRVEPDLSITLDASEECMQALAKSGANFVADGTVGNRIKFLENGAGKYQLCLNPLVVDIVKRGDRYVFEQQKTTFISSTDDAAGLPS